MRYTIPLSFFESVGRAVADLGFSGVIEKFEEHWGKRATRVLLLIIGLGVAAVCVGAIWEWFVSPILNFLKSPERSNTVWSIVLATLGVGAGISFTSGLITAVVNRRRVKYLNNVVTETETKAKHIMDQARGMLDETFKRAETVEALLEGGLLLTRAAVSANPSMSEEQRAEMLAAMDEARQELKAKQSEQD